MYIHLMTTLLFSLLIGQKQWREKKKHHVTMRDKIVQKLSQNGCTNIISLPFLSKQINRSYKILSNYSKHEFSFFGNKKHELFD